MGEGSERQIRQFTIEQRAYHEAGHAVVGYCLGLDLGPATIIPDEEAGTEGVSSSESPVCDGSRYEGNIVSLYAGGAAQRRFDPTAGDSGCGRDNEEAAALLGDHYDESTLRQRAEELVESHWGKIEAVASMLIEEKTLSGDDIGTICVAIEEGVDWRTVLDEVRRRQK